MVGVYNLGTKLLNVDCNCQRRWIFWSQYGRGLIQLEQGTFNIHKAKIRCESAILRRLLQKESRYKEHSLIPWAELRKSWPSELTTGEDIWAELPLHTWSYRKPSPGRKCLAGSQHQGQGWTVSKTNRLHQTSYQNLTRWENPERVSKGPRLHTGRWMPSSGLDGFHY